MKAFKILVFILSSFRLFAQPGPDVIFPTDINLNQYPNFRSMRIDTITFHFREKMLGIITIDSTSDLSLIPLLKKEKYIALRISTPEVPAEFNGFSQTVGLSLIIESDSTDVAFINEFPNIKDLKLKTTGNIGFSEYLSLDSLKLLEVEFCEELTSLESFKKVNSIEKISLRYVPRLKEFPKFEINNQVKYVQIYQESGDGCTNCPPNPNKLDITNLNKLKRLEELELSNVNGITKIPDDLSKELRVFKIFDIKRANRDFAIRSYIEDVSGFANYGKLEVIDLSGVHIKNFNGNFEKIKLKKLTLNALGLQNISGIFTFNSIDIAKIKSTHLKSIIGEKCAVKIDQLILEDGTRLENIDFLLMCPNINFLRVECNEKLKIPSHDTWKIPNVSISNGTLWYYIRTNSGTLIEKSENFEDNFK